MSGGGTGKTVMTEEEKRRLSTEEARRAHDRNEDFYLTIDESTIKSADAALRTLLLINGGAAVAVLAFAGAVVSKGTSNHQIVAHISRSLAYFAWGVVIAAVALCVTYLVHFATGWHTISHLRVWDYPYVIPGKRTMLAAKVKRGLHLLAILLAVASVVVFICGLITVGRALTFLPG